MRITKVYTRTGDAGMTRLAGGEQVKKDHLRVEAYGTVDELNSVVGLVRAFNLATSKEDPSVLRLERELRWLQNKLFDVGGVLATSSVPDGLKLPQITNEDVLHLEQLMDHCQEDLAPLQEFVLPGGGKVSGFLHQARTVCRRAERICVTLSEAESIDPNIIKFLNRVSDALFVLARWSAKIHGEPEFLWQREG